MSDPREDLKKKFGEEWAARFKAMSDEELCLQTIALTEMLTALQAEYHKRTLERQPVAGSA